MSEVRYQQSRITTTYQTIRDFAFSTGGAFFLGVGMIFVLNLIWMGLPASFQNSYSLLGSRRDDQTSGNIGALLLRMAMTSVLAIIFMSLYAIHIRKLRRSRARMVLNHLAAAVQMRLPIANYLESAALSEDGNIRHRLTAMASLVRMGVPLGTALYTSNGELDMRIPSMIDAAERTGQLDAILPQLTRTESLRTDNAFASATISYLAITISFMSCVIAMVLIFVLPKFNEIFNDFHIKLPASTQMLLRYPFELLLLLVIPLTIFVLVMLANVSRRIISSRQELRWYAGIIDWLRWHTPIARTIYRDQAHTDFCWIIAGAVDSGYTINDALQAANRVDVNRLFRSKVVSMLALHLNGVDASIAATQSGMPNLIASMFKSTGQAQLSEALRFAARTYESRLNRSLVVIQSALPVLATLIISVIVGYIAVSLFEPIATLITATSPYKIGL